MIQNLDILTSLTRKYESNNDPAMVSSGYGDIGGISFGKYQFSSTVGVVNEFVNWLCSYPEKAFANYGKVLLENYPVDGINFINTWKQIGIIDPGNFGRLQDEFMLKQYYYPMFPLLKNKYFTIDKHSPAVQAVIVSRSVQNGPNGCAKLFELACTEMLEFDNLSYIDDPYFDDQLITAIYDFLIDECDSVYWDNNAGYYRSNYNFCHAYNMSVINGLRNRFIHEKTDALNLLK